MNDASDWYRRVESLYQQALDLPPQGRGAFLASACSGDRRLLNEVELLLSHFVRAQSSFLDLPAHDLASIAPAAGQLPEHIGRYRILDLLGVGGMGAVYRAQQENPQRLVALKVIRRGIAGADALRRFELEAALLGRLKHPGIAQIYEAGMHDDGAGPRPFFAMELIEGAPLHAFVKERRLDVGARIELFTRICEAVEHAHQKGVIHRDLKPANILVSDGSPKILDFGVARATDSDLQMTTLQTEVGCLIGTLAYMSPEQADGHAHSLDTRSDLYSLGVILYELLADRLPYDLRDQSIAGALRIISSGPPLPLNAIDRAYRGDLDTIVLKSIEKDAERRYASASEFAADLRRYLQHEPILARPATHMYRLRKFVQRNRTLTGGVAATFVALVAGVIGTSYGLLQTSRQRDEAARQRDEAERQTSIATAVNQFFTWDLLDLANPRNEADREIPMHVALDRAAAKIEGRFTDAPLVEASIRKAIGKMYRNLGRAEPAERHLSRALELYQAHFGESDGSTLYCRMELAGVLVDRSAHKRAEQEYLRLLEAQRRALGPEHEQTINTLVNLGSLYFEQGRVAEAEPILLEGLELHLRVHGEDSTQTAATMTNLAVVYGRLGRTPDQMKMLERALDIHTRVSGPEHPDTLVTIANLSSAYYRLKQYKKAEEFALRALELHRRVLGPEHRATLRLAHSLAVIYGQLGKTAEREALLRETLEVQRRVLGEEHLDTLQTRNELAYEAYRQGEYTAADAEYADMIARLGDAHPRHWLTAHSRAMRGRCLIGLGRLDEAEPFLLKAHQLFSDTLGPEQERTRKVEQSLVTLYERWNKPDDAAQWREKSASTQPTQQPGPSAGD